MWILLAAPAFADADFSGSFDPPTGGSDSTTPTGPTPPTDGATTAGTADSGGGGEKGCACASVLTSPTSAVSLAFGLAALVVGRRRA